MKHSHELIKKLLPITQELIETIEEMPPEIHDLALISFITVTLKTWEDYRIDKGHEPKYLKIERAYNA